MENEEIKNDMKSEKIIVIKKLYERQQIYFNCFCALNLSWFVADMEFSFNNISLWSFITQQIKVCEKFN